MRDGVHYPSSSVEASRKKAKLEELSNKISERRCELKAIELVSEQSERASVDFVGYKGKLSSSEINRETALSYFFLVFCGTCFGNTFFLKFFIFFESSSEIGETFPTFWLGNFCPIVKTEVYVFRGNIWGIQFFWKTFYLQRWILKEKIPISWWNMSAELIRLHSTCPERLFADLSSFADHLRTLSEKFSEFWWWSFGTVAKTAIYLFRRTMKEWKNVFFWIYFVSFGHWPITCWLWWKLLSRVVKTAFLMSAGTLGGRARFWKKISFINCRHSTKLFHCFGLFVKIFC